MWLYFNDILFLGKHIVIVIQLRGRWCLLFMAFDMLHESAYKNALNSHNEVYMPLSAHEMENTIL